MSVRMTCVKTDHLTSLEESIHVRTLSCSLPFVLLIRVMSGALLGIRALGKRWQEALGPVSGSSGER